MPAKKFPKVFKFGFITLFLSLVLSTFIIIIGVQKTNLQNEKNTKFLLEKTIQAIKQNFTVAHSFSSSIAVFFWRQNVTTQQEFSDLCYKLISQNQQISTIKYSQIHFSENMLLTDKFSFTKFSKMTIRGSKRKNEKYTLMQKNSLQSIIESGNMALIANDKTLIFIKPTYSGRGPFTDDQDRQARVTGIVQIIMDKKSLKDDLTKNVVHTPVRIDFISTINLPLIIFDLYRDNFNRDKQTMTQVHFPNFSVHAEIFVQSETSLFKNIDFLIYFAFAIIVFMLGLYGTEFQRRQVVTLEKMNEKQKAVMEKASRLAALGQMAGGIAHEINNPLTIIQGNSDLLKMFLKKDIVDEKKVFHCLDNIDETIARINKVVKSMLIVSRGEVNTNKETVPLRESINLALSLSQEKFKTQGVHITMNKENKSFDTLLHYDSVHLSRVFLNILNNAYDAIAELSEKWIKITAFHDKDCVYVQISNAGPGISKKVADKIFDPYFTTKDVGKGTGLGLSITASLLKENHGSIALIKRENPITFEIKLPQSKIL